MRYEVSVKASYVPTWGINEALREFVANAFDAEVEMSARATVRYEKSNETLYIENDDVTVPREALLFGHTTKAGGKEGCIGQFGEGLKLACLAAVRDGHKVRIRSGSEVWLPAMVPSRAFPGTDVLGFDIVTGHKEKPRTVVEVVGISPEKWEDFKKTFIRLAAPLKSKTIETSEGSLIEDPRFAGRVYVRGVLVQDDPRLGKGYDLKNVQIDRDRKMINSWERDSAIQSIWTEASRKSAAIKDGFVQNLFDQTKDTAGVTAYNAYSVDDALVEAAVDFFVSKYGTNAIPVDTMGESKELEHLGKVGVVLPPAVRAVVARKLGSLVTIRQQLHEEVVKSYSWNDLSPTAQFNLDRAIEIVNKARPITLSDIDIVDFRSGDLQGQYKNKRILVASSVLSDVSQTIKLLVHERAHAQGRDGEKSHVQEIEESWADLVKGLL
jgi:hypothetical protein